MQVCCRLKNGSSISNANTDRHPKGCGYRNPNGISFKITGHNRGETQFGEFPWLVAIRRFSSASEVICGGAIIHSQVILTAAHCVNEGKSYYIRAGDWDQYSTKEPYGHEDAEVDFVVIHSRFTPGNLHNDIALLFLKKAIKSGPHIDTICLPPQNYEAHVGRCFTSGWGKVSEKYKEYFPHIMKKVSVFQLPRDLCLEELRKTRLSKYFQLHNSFLCAGEEQGAHTCKGDGGNPLACPIKGQPNRYYQAGIISWGIGCGQQNIPGVYVDVAKFRQWIDQQMKQYGLSTHLYQF